MKYFGILLFMACCLIRAQADPIGNNLRDDVNATVLDDDNVNPDCPDCSNGKKTIVCFYSQDTVRTPSGTKTLKDVVANDLVLTISEEGMLKYEHVLLDAHPLPDADTLFFKIETPTRELMVTPGHYIYVGETIETSKLVKSDDIEVGDSLLVYSSGSVEVEKVEKVEMVRAKGISNPVVPSGRLLVNDILASIYTDEFANLSVVNQHQLVWMVRQFFKFNLEEIFTIYHGSNGIPLVANYFLQLTAE